MKNFAKISAAVLLLVLCLSLTITEQNVPERGIYCLGVGASCSKDAEEARNKGKRIYCLGGDLICTKPIQKISFGNKT